MRPQVTRLDDLDDPRLAIYRNLKATNETRGSALFVVEGRKLVDRLCASRYPLVSILASEHADRTILERLPKGVALYQLPQGRLETLVGYNFHRGVLAAARRLDGPSLDEIVRASHGDPTFVVCPQIDNPENLGSIIRLVDVFGATGLIVGPRCPDPLSRRVLRVSMGTSLSVPVLTPDDLALALRRLRDDRGFTLVATVCSGPAERLDQFRSPGRLAILLGTEGDGLAPEWRELCRRRLTIPMRPGAESLNVAVAAGILLYDLSLRKKPALREKGPWAPTPDDFGFFD
jgi:tRNA G18 (ribose-2'-O)-methylase SpoU